MNVGSNSDIPAGHTQAAIDMSHVKDRVKVQIEHVGDYIWFDFNVSSSTVMVGLPFAADVTA